MKFKGRMEEWGGYSAYWDYELDPADFLYCADEQTLLDEVYDKLLEMAELKIPDTMDCECDEFHTNLPPEFIEEWKRLKGIEDGA